jgi:hypothetical protein
MPFNDIKDYAKCVYQNKFTFTGYIGVVSFIGVNAGRIYFDIPDFEEPWDLVDFLSNSAVFLYSIISLGLTSLGNETMDNYQRTRDHIEQFGRVEDYFDQKMSKTYCTRVGMKLAAKEYGLEDKIQ